MLELYDALVLSIIIICATIYVLNKPCGPSITIQHAPLSINETIETVFKRVGWDPKNYSDAVKRFKEELEKVTVVVKQ
jgi:hypothetical protein